LIGFPTMFGRTRLGCAPRRVLSWVVVPKIWPATRAHSSGWVTSVFARGKDPYFAPWPDVVQVNPFAPSLRRLAAATLTRIAAHADAVRCDMAMLMLDDVVAATWGDRVGPPPEQTYWREVITAVRGAHPGFRFVAEAYWDREGDLQQLGFDYCHDKRLYDRLAQGDSCQVRAHVEADPGRLVPAALGRLPPGCATAPGPGAR
jgi:hypothetical protein